MTGNKAAVIGAGAMGAGIAHALASASVEVVLIDIAPEFVDKGVKQIGARLASDVKRGRLSEEEKDLIAKRITGTVSLESAADVDFAIEAIVESKTLKRDLFQKLDRICKPEALFATNTSTLSVSDLAFASGRPDRLLGLHFFNPVHVMKLVEVIPGLDTEAAAVQSAVALVKAMKKTPIVVQDCPGFLVNRVLLSYIGEAFLCVQEGISPATIDEEAKKAGFPMGPLQLTDMVGLDVSLHTLPVLEEAYGERYPFPELVRKLNDAGRLGLKSGKGVYCNGEVDDELKRIIEEIPGGKKGEAAPFSIDRPILRLVNEAIYCLQEGVAAAEEIDRAMVLGTGFPAVDGGAGGPLHWADAKGLNVVLSSLEAFSASEGSRFWPHHLLKRYVSGGRLGKKTGKGFFTY